MFIFKHVLTIFNSSGLRNWDPEDNPWIEHARWSAECPYILKMKGQAFIDLVQEAARAADMADSDEDNEADNESVSGGFCLLNIYTDTYLSSFGTCEFSNSKFSSRTWYTETVKSWIFSIDVNYFRNHKWLILHIILYICIKLLFSEINHNKIIKIDISLQ